MDIELVIPIFNRPDYTEACLQSLLDVDFGIGIRPIIVDNGSRRKTKSVISDFVDKWRSSGKGDASCLPLDSNAGFAGAINAYLKSSRFEALPRDGLVMIMHNDIVAVQPGWAKEMVEVYQSLLEDDELAALMPRTCYANELSVCHEDARKSFSTIKPHNKDRMLVSEITSLVEKTYEPLGGLTSYLEPLRAREPRFSYCPEIASFCMLVRAELFRKYGAFDQDFFPRGYEDKWWFLKLERDGMCCHVANRAWIHHFGNITSDGPGFDFRNSQKVLTELYNEKSRLSYTGAMHGKDSNSEP